MNNSLDRMGGKAVYKSDDTIIADFGGDNRSRFLEFRGMTNNNNEISVYEISARNSDEILNAIDPAGDSDIQTALSSIRTIIFPKAIPFSSQTKEQCKDPWYNKEDSQRNYIHRYEGVDIVLKESLEQVSKNRRKSILDTIEYQLLNTNLGIAYTTLSDELGSNLLEQMKNIGGNKFRVAGFDYDIESSFGFTGGVKFGVGPQGCQRNKIHVVRKDELGHMVSPNQVGNY